MPQCYRCGRILVTQQSLSYHMNKKNKCTKYSCDTCRLTFKNQCEYDIHINECKAKTERYNTYDTIYSQKTVIIEVDNSGYIRYISKNIEDILKTNRTYYNGNEFKILFKEIDDYDLFWKQINQNESNKSSIVYSSMTSENKTVSFDMDAKRYSDYIVVSQTYVYVLASAM